MLISISEIEFNCFFVPYEINSNQFFDNIHAKNVKKFDLGKLLLKSILIIIRIVFLRFLKIVDIHELLNL